MISCFVNEPETCPLHPREGHKFKVFEKRALRRIFEPVGVKVQRGTRDGS